MASDDIGIYHRILIYYRILIYHKTVIVFMILLTWEDFRVAFASIYASSKAPSPPGLMQNNKCGMPKRGNSKAVAFTARL